MEGDVRTDQRVAPYGIYGILLAAALLAFLPHFQKGVIPWFDAAYHLSRIETLYEALQAGVFPVKVHPSFGGYGYGSGFFYPNTLLYLPALFMLAGLSLEAAYKLFTFCLLTALAIAMYHSCRILSCSRQVSVMMAVFYLFSDRILYNIYDRYALGETSAAIFLPIAIAGVYLFMVREGSPLWMITGIAGLLLTHTITTVLAACTCLILLVLQVKKIRKWKEKIVWGAMSAGTVLLICASYLLPMWQQMRAQRLKAAAPWTVSSEHVQPLSAVAGASGIGLPVLLLTVLCGVFLIRGKAKCSEIARESLPFLVTGTGAAILPAVRPFFVWMNRMGIRLIQFPDRIYNIAIVCLLFFGGMVLSTGGVLPEGMWKRRRVFPVITILVIVLVAIHAIYIFRYVGPARNTILEQVAGHGNDTLGAGEWLPLETDILSLTEPELTTDDTGSEIAGEKRDYGRYYVFATGSAAEYYLVPYVYYRGYEAVTGTGVRLDTGKDPDSGLLRVLVPDEGLAEGTEVTVQYTGTQIMRISYLLSVAGVICCMIIGAVWRRKHAVN